MKNFKPLFALLFVSTIAVGSLSSCMKSACHANKKHAVSKHKHYNSIQYRSYGRSHH